MFDLIFDTLFCFLSVSELFFVCARGFSATKRSISFEPFASEWDLVFLGCCFGSFSFLIVSFILSPSI